MPGSPTLSWLVYARLALLGSTSRLTADFAYRSTQYASKLQMDNLKAAIIGGIVICAASVACNGAASRDSDVKESPFLGGWLLVQTTKVTPDSTWTDSTPPVGLYVFADQHFSIMLVDADEPRSLFPSGGTEAASSEQRLRAYDPFIADAGTYQFDDSILTTRNIIAKVPNVMNYEITHRYRIAGDSLWLTFSGAWAPPGGEITYRLVRHGGG